MITCDSCNQEMKLQKSSKKPYHGSVKKYECKLCNLTKTIHGNHEEDEPIIYDIDEIKEGYSSFCRHNIPFIDCEICNYEY